MLLGRHILLLIQILRFVLVVVGIGIGIIVVGLYIDSVILFDWFKAFSAMTIEIEIIILGFYDCYLCCIKKAYIVWIAASIWTFLELFFPLLALNLYWHIIAIRKTLFMLPTMVYIVIVMNDHLFLFRILLSLVA